jgi:hypothetical protein
MVRHVEPAAALIKDLTAMHISARPIQFKAPYTGMPVPSSESFLRPALILTRPCQ